MAYTGRTRMLLQILARHPEGLTTPQLAQAIGGASRPSQRALNHCGTAMRLHERLGRAVRVGTVPGRRARAVIWQITPAGAAWLASRALTSLQDAKDAQQAHTHARDLRAAAERMVQFHVDASQPANGDCSQPRTTPPPQVAALSPGQWTVAGLAAELGMPIGTLYDWIYRGQVAAVFGDRWVVHADAAELAKLRALRAQNPARDSVGGGGVTAHEGQRPLPRQGTGATVRAATAGDSAGIGGSRPAF